MTVGAIAVTEGSGKNIWTDQRTVSAVAREAQFVLPAEPTLATYTAQGISVATTTADSHLFQLMAGASNYVRINRIIVEQAANATTAGAKNITVLRLTTAGSGGSSVTPHPFDTGDAASGATAQTLPSSKGTESVELLRAVITFRQAVATTGTQIDDIWVWEAHARSKGIIIPAGTSNGIAVKLIEATVGATVHVTLEFTETAWL